MDRLINWIVSQTSCLATKINLIVEIFTGHKFSVEDYDLAVDRGSSFFHSLQRTMDPVINGFMSMIRNLATKINGDLLLRVGSAVGVAVAAIVVVWLLWTLISTVVWLLWKVTCAVVSLPWKVISGGVRFLWKVIKTIFCCGGKGGGKTMKAPGRNIRILRNDFARSPKNYFRELHKK